MPQQVSGLMTQRSWIWCVLQGPRSLHTAKQSKVRHAIRMSIHSRVLSSKPNQKITPNTTCCIFQGPYCWMAAPWVQMSNIYIVIFSVFLLTELNLPYSNLAQELQLPSWVFSISKKNKQLISNFMVLYFRWFWKLFNLLSPGTVAETKRHQTTLVCLSLIYKLHWCFDSHEVGMWGNLHSTTAAALETLNSYPTRFHNQKQSWTRV